MDDKLGAKEKILETVVQLLLEGQDASKVTNRQIAAMAGVNSALINYYFQSKDQLMGMAAGICMESIAGTLQQHHDDSSPAERIKQMLRKFSDFCFKNSTIAEIAIGSDLKQGSAYTSGLLLPLFREHYGNSKTELQLRLLTFQLLHPLQILFIHRAQYKAYLSYDLYSQEALNQIIENLVDNLFRIGEAK